MALLLAALPPQSRAAVTPCASEVVPFVDDRTPGELFVDVDKKSPKLAKYLDSPAFGRFKKSKDPGWASVRQAIVDCPPGGKTKLQLDSDTFYFKGRVKRSEDGVLTVTVIDFRLKVRDPRTGQMRRVIVGERPRVLTTTFFNLFGTLMDGIETAVKRVPVVHKVRIVGSTVLNPHLKDILVSLGFKTVPLASAEHVLSVAAKATKGTVMAVGLAPHDALAPQTKAAVAAGNFAVTEGLRAFQLGGNSWALDLDVKP